MIVIKRDGRKQEFDFQKVVDVIHNTYDAINQEVPDKFIEQLKGTFDKELKRRDEIDVEDIQDIIQNELIKRNQYKVVEEFIVYRNKRKQRR